MVDIRSSPSGPLRSSIDFTPASGMSLRSNRAFFSSSSGAPLTSGTAWEVKNVPEDSSAPTSAPYVRPSLDNCSLTKLYEVNADLPLFVSSITTETVFSLKLQISRDGGTTWDEPAGIADFGSFFRVGPAVGMVNPRAWTARFLGSDVVDMEEGDTLQARLVYLQTTGDGAMVTSGYSGQQALQVTLTEIEP